MNHCTNLTTADSEKVINTVFEGIGTALKKGEEASFLGFGSFVVVKREAREGRNPRTGEKMKITAANQVKSHPGKNLKESVNA